MSSARVNSSGGESSSHRGITASVCAGLALGLLGAAAGAPARAATTLPVSTCDSGAANPPACNRAVVHGDRAQGWLAQGRSEVMARNGIVTTSQPLAAEAGS
jgi:hypothetical protein